MKSLKSFIFLLSLVLLFFGCANRVTPLGGIKDVLPPVIVSINPAQKSTDFISKDIVITFNEYVQLKEISKQLVISPLIIPAPQIAVRKKSIVIELPDSLAPNTTYSINFGNSITDNNESNVLPYFSYVFSTGSFIDSLKVDGKIINAETKKPEKDALALLYKSSLADSLFLKMPPDYFAKTSEEGVFAIRNIKPGSYKLFALTDKNQNLIFDTKDETVGFVSDAFKLIDSLNFIVPVAKQLPLTQSVKSYAIEDPAKLITVFSRPLLNPSFKFVSGTIKNVLAEYSTFKDTVNLFCEPFGLDTIKIVWYENDIPFDTVQYKKNRGQISKDTSPKKAAPWSSYPLQSSALKAETNPSIKWSAPIVNFDTSLVSILKDSLPYAAKFYFTDSLKTNLQAEGNWKEGNYSFVILPLAVTDMYDRKNDSVVVAFSIPGERTVGSISFKLQTQKSGNYLLQLVNEKDEVLRQRLTKGKMEGVFEQVDPGAFRLRIVYDDNENGRWDSGDYLKGIQPEVIEYNMEVVTVRANWEVEVDWIR